MLDIALGNPQGSKILSAGRVVILRDGVSVSYPFKKVSI